MGCGAVYILCEPTFRRKVSAPSSVEKTPGAREKREQVLQNRSLRPPPHVPPSLADFSPLKTEAICSSERSVHTRSTQRNILEGGILHSHRRENVKIFHAVFFLISGVGLWVLRPLTGLLYQPRMIGDGDCG
jgi:hypothetical protein